MLVCGNKLSIQKYFALYSTFKSNYQLNGIQENTPSFFTVVKPGCVEWRSTTINMKDYFPCTYSTFKPGYQLDRL